ncbi:hypothetical protein ACSQ67_023888 [Phaseolus vulgaris]
MDCRIKEALCDERGEELNPTPLVQLFFTQASYLSLSGQLFDPCYFGNFIIPQPWSFGHPATINRLASTFAWPNLKSRFRGYTLLVIYFNRTLRKDMELGNSSLPAGVDVTMPILLFHKDGDIRGNDAKEFKPGRLSKELLKQQKAKSHFTHLDAVLEFALAKTLPCWKPK